MTMGDTVTDTTTGTTVSADADPALPEAARQVFITVSAVGANSLPYVNHSCDQFDNKLECSTALKGSLLKIERPPTWAWFAEPEKTIGDGPERAGVMGTDRNGFDIFARAMLGARNSLIIAGFAITFGLAIGTFLGMIAGYFRGWADALIENFTNVLLAFPPLLLAIFFVTFFNPPNSTDAATSRPLWPIITALVILSIPPLTRLVRANTIAYAQRDFVVAARSLGAKRSRILFREILPNIVPTLLSFALTGLALLIVAEAPTPTWGAMISAGSERLRNGIWWISLMPAFVMFLTVLSINLLGDVFAQRFNSREAIA
ncbi:MAG: peptide/nickel transport system permease protein [Acidimicrobiaceae bacterium]|nr:MAG: peptide/nickel transport system permease protein [Acidimicrobiaceae bacterium]